MKVVEGRPNALGSGGVEVELFPRRLDVGSWDGWRGKEKEGSWRNFNGLGGNSGIVGGRMNFRKERRTIDARKTRKEKAILDKTKAAGKEVGENTKGKGEKSDGFGNSKRGGREKVSGNGDLKQKEEIDPELTFGRIVKLEELLARGADDRVKLEKRTNYLIKVVEDLQLEAEEERNFVQPTPGEANFGSTDVRLKKRKLQCEVNPGSTGGQSHGSTPVARCRGARGRPEPAGKLGLEGGKSLSTGDLYNHSQQVWKSAQVLERSKKSDPDVLLPLERIASGLPQEEGEEVVDLGESKSIREEELHSKQVDEAVNVDDEVEVESTGKEVRL